ncbi:hypothetical protein BBI15_08900 [Planococcus plakortidis]|uniref:DUF3243 domain-containing protein n=2 Tax=Planococcus TaxID=1372 RepID=A0A1C7E9G6_9BACL|nr:MULTISPECIES: DUF3243 domain-containing protein [Planococcus]ANU20325.1 hypothetical protein BBI15_08900 [Planococcus plakortidis]AUD14728.1 DUF3243 domain-containing protein [Planococcus sp. MB-3u-03]PKG45036.1 DUF3243 domain-containing protein [Planococcus sp. Urea-trap-24]PKG87379.1 DUF3243 domain-containing protein [Planococcus sp. Urea-3u-39]PKH42504.1 DUF3243 domain-containing protein [Planococcus sp. MB-3u-09]
MENIDKKVEEKLSNTDNKKKEQILAEFSTFIDYLGDKVQMGEKMGLSEERIAQLASKVADYLAKKEDPKNSEEYLLQRLWQVGDKEEQHMLAHMLVKLAKEQN